MADSEEYERLFGEKVPEDANVDLVSLKNLIVSMGSGLKTEINSSTTTLSKELREVRDDVKGVKNEVKVVRKEVSAIEKRVVELERGCGGPSGQPRVSRDQISAAEEAKRIVVFWPVEGFSNDRRAEYKNWLLCRW